MSACSPTVAQDDAPEGCPQEGDAPPSGCVLIVDDEDAVRELVAHSVERLGFAARVACNGEQAISGFEPFAQRYSLVILDLKLPGIDGIEVLRKLREIRPDIPVVLMSGYFRNQPEAQVMAAAPTRFLNKPFTLSALAAEIRAVLKH